MTTRAPLVLVGFDSCDPDIARRFAAEGHMPNLARLFDRGARAPVRNPPGVFVGALWMTFATGLRPDRHQYHCWDEIDVDSYERVLTVPPAGDAARPFWRALSDAGRRVAVLDVPHSKADGPVNGLEVSEWGCHDRHFGFRTWPPKRAADIDAAFGLHAVLGIDAYTARAFAPDDWAHREGKLRTVEEDAALLADMRRGLAGKRKLSNAVLAEDDWDLFATVFGESHCIGHQQWHLHDPSHPRFDPEGVRAVGGDPLLLTYRDFDAALGEMLERLDDRATVLVHLSHGMDAHNDGCHLLDVVLKNIDRTDRSPLWRQLGKLSPSARARMTAYAVPLLRARNALGLSRPCPEFVDARSRARQSFYMEPNNFVFGGIRLNLAGREPNGCVAPQDADDVCDRLTKDLLALVNIETGGPVIRAIERSDRSHRRTPTDTFPDLFVTWEQSAPIEAIWSPKAGFVSAPTPSWRSGDHRPDGLLLARGPGIPENAILPDLNIEDIGPSIMARLGAPSRDLDGRAAPWLANQN